MALKSSMNLSNGSPHAPDPKNSRHSVLRQTVDTMHHCLRKFFAPRVGYNPKQLKLLSKECSKSHIYQKELDGSVLQSMQLAISTYEKYEVHIESNEEDGHILLAEDNFNWELKGTTTMIDLKARPVADILGSSNPGENQAMYAANGYQGSSCGKILNSIFHQDSIEMGKHYEKMIGEDPRNPLLLRNYGHYLYQFKGNLVGAENCYLPALLLDPENSQYLAEYAVIAWELHHSEWITKYFFQRALKSSPDDSFVNAAYASFLYQIEDDED